MRKSISFITIAAALLMSLMLTSCTEGDMSDTEGALFDDNSTTTTTTTTPTVSETIDETTTEKIETEPSSEHSELYIEGVSVEEVIEYFNEVCLDAEFVIEGDPSVLQKWESPIYYSIDGYMTGEDEQTLEGFVSWLNTVEGFPGMYEGTADSSDMQITFCTQEDLLAIMGDNYVNTDGAVEFWYMDDVIYSAKICYRTDIDQMIRNSVIIEEIYNSLGPIQDTWLREDSVIYAGYSTPQQQTEIDELIIRLLYSEDMKCGMNKAQCEEVIRRLYY